MGKVIAFNDAGKARRSATVRPQPTTKKGYLNHHLKDAIVRQWLTADGNLWQITKDLRKVYGAQIRLRTVERVIKESVRFEQEAA